VTPVPNRIVVHRAARRLEVRKLADGRLLLSARIAVGKPGAETPLGRDYYVQARFVPVDRFYGTFALETSAYSQLTDWPGGGRVGIHGTSLPELIGQAVSHGCIRLNNRDAGQLKRLAPLGTPIDILP
jgi:lipoprotein-anchoring transpeptidase ErfK/SrfK